VSKQNEGKRAADEERIFVKDGLRSFRKTFRLGEVYWGAGTGAVLLGIVGWVTWKGAHPDPSLFDMSAALEGGKAPPGDGAARPEDATRPAGSRLGAPRAERGSPATEGEGAEPGTADRGPLPSDLGQGGFREGKVGAYSADTMYVKINGRAGYFQSFGVQTLHTVTLEGPSETAPTSVDIEAYDMGESRNAIGAYNGERPSGVASSAADGSSFHVDRNAAFLARGRHYVRFIGSDESPEVVGEVRRLLDVFRRALPGEALPWGFALFVDQMKLDASVVTYVKSNAFSFGFARDVFKASLSPANSQEDMEAFVVALADDAAAKALAEQFGEGFATLGKPGGKTPAGVKLVEDEFLGTFSGAAAVERWTLGVRGAPTRARASDELERLSRAIAALPADVRARAVPSSQPDAPVGEYAGAAEAAPARESDVSSVKAEASPEGSGAEPDESPAPGEERDRRAAPAKPAEESSDEY
jgi:hypothetical protein